MLFSMEKRKKDDYPAKKRNKRDSKFFCNSYINARGITRPRFCCARKQFKSPLP